MSSLSLSSVSCSSRFSHVREPLIFERISFVKGKYWTVGLFIGKGKEKNLIEIVFRPVMTQAYFISKFWSKEGEGFSSQEKELQRCGYDLEGMTISKNYMTLEFPFITVVPKEKTTVVPKEKGTVSLKEKGFCPVLLYSKKKEEKTWFRKKEDATKEAIRIHSERLKSITPPLLRAGVAYLFSLDGILAEEPQRDSSMQDLPR